MIYTLTEIREFQLNCIRQLKELISKAVTMPHYRRNTGSEKPCDKFIQACEDEILLRKDLFNHPEKVQV